MFKTSNSVLNAVWLLKKENKQFVLFFDNLNSSPIENVKDLAEIEMNDSERRKMEIKKKIETQ